MDIEIIEDTKKSSNKKGLLIGIIVVLLAAVIGGITYFIIINNSPKKIFVSVVDSNVKKILKTIDEDNEISNFIKFLNNNKNIEYKLDNSIKYEMNGESISASALVDILKNDNRYKLDLKAKLQNREFFDGTVILDNDKIYGKLKEFSNYYFQDLGYSIDSLISISNESKENYKLLMNKLLGAFPKALDKALKDSDIVKGNDKVNIFNEEIDCSKYTIVINSDLMKRISNEYNNYIKEDDELIDLLSKMASISKEEVKNKLNENQDGTNYDDMKDINLSVYLNNKEVVLIELVNENSDIRFSNYKDNFNIEIKSNNSSFVINAIKNNDKYDVSLCVDGKEYITGNVKIDKKSFEYELYYNIDDLEKIKIYGTNSFENNNNAYNLKGNINFELSVMSYKLKLGYDFNLDIKEGKKFSSDEYSNAKKIEDMSEEDLEIIESLGERIQEILDEDFGLSNSIIGA